MHLGKGSERIMDVGVSGLHRLLGRLDDLKKYKVVIAVAGFEAALPTVLGGLIPQPIIAVPTSVGYGAAFNGVAVCELNQYLWSSKTDGGARERAVAAMRQSLRIERKQPRIVELLRRYKDPSGTEQ